MKKAFSNTISAIFLLFFLIISACSCHSQGTTLQADNDNDEVAGPAAVTITTEEGRRIQYNVEVAYSHNERQKGLMGRTELPEDKGMLFVFSYRAYQSFWMKDTPLPLDMIFIGDDFRIAGIRKNTRPYDTSTYSVDAPSQFVLEVNAGQSEKYGFKTGNNVAFENIDISKAERKRY